MIGALSLLVGGVVYLLAAAVICAAADSASRSR